VKYATVQYRYVNTEHLWEDFNLKAMVVDILRRAARGNAQTRLFEDVSARKKDLDQDGTYVVLNKMSDPRTWGGPFFCGQLLHVKAGVDVPGINGDLDQSVPELELCNLQLGNAARIVEGVLYFLVNGNHVSLIEGQRTKARSLERYLTRLLQDADELDPGKTIILNALFSSAGSGVTEIQEMNIQPLAVPANGAEQDATRLAVEERGQGKTVYDILEYLGWTEADISDLRGNLPEGGTLEGLFKVFIKLRNKRKGSVPKRVLEEALRHLDPYSLQLIGPDGKEGGGLIKLSKRVRIQTTGDLLNPDDAMEKIQETMREWARDGKIDCDFGE